MRLMADLSCDIVESCGYLLFVRAGVCKGIFVCVCERVNQLLLLKLLQRFHTKRELKPGSSSLTLTESNCSPLYTHTAREGPKHMQTISHQKLVKYSVVFNATLHSYSLPAVVYYLSW